MGQKIFIGNSAFTCKLRKKKSWKKNPLWRKKLISIIFGVEAKRDFIPFSCILLMGNWEKIKIFGCCWMFILLMFSLKKKIIIITRLVLITWIYSGDFFFSRQSSRRYDLVEVENHPWNITYYSLAIYLDLWSFHEMMLLKWAIALWHRNMPVCFFILFVFVCFRENLVYEQREKMFRLNRVAHLSVALQNIPHNCVVCFENPRNSARSSPLSYHHTFVSHSVSLFFSYFQDFVECERLNRWFWAVIQIERIE